VQAGELDTAIDAIRNKFGGAALTSADRIGFDVGFGVPLLPDESGVGSKNGLTWF
jgi:DNA polymerase-4